MAADSPIETVKGVRSRLSRRWQALKQNRPGVGHVVTAYQHYKDNHGDHLAAAITYFSFLALFPLVLLGVSITAFVLASDHHLRDELLHRVSTGMRGGFGDTVKTAIDTAIKQRAGVGVIGLIGVALSGLGWIDNLRTAIDTVWGLPESKRSFVAKKLSDALVLLGLGAGVVISLAVTAGGTAASGLLLRACGLDDVTGAGTVTWLIGIALGILGNMVIFGWLMIRLPDLRVTRRTAVRATLLAAVGFEVLKIVGTYYIARVTHSPAAAVIGPVVGVLVWIDLVSRYQLFCVAWAATSEPERSRLAPVDPPVEGPPVPPTLGPAAAVSPVGIAAGIFSAGAAVGAGSLAILRRQRERPRRTTPE